MVTTDVKEVTVIRFKDRSDGVYTYLSDVSQYEDGTWSTGIDYSIEDASDLSNMKTIDQFDLFSMFQEENEDENLEFVTIKITTEVTDMMSQEEGEFKELRQRLALQKLSESDIKALGIMNIFTYIKTKYA